MSSVIPSEARDRVQLFQHHIRAAATNSSPLRIRGSGSKDFYGSALEGDLLDTRTHTGIVAYEPTELYVTARCGTPIAELERALDAQGQMLAFEPPRHSPDATVGGMVAAGLSGPRRVQAGAIRDYVLGVELLDGNAQVLRFGGRVIKNVAGYDVSRLLCGSLGTLGLITEVTLKVLPRPAAELSLRFELSQADALARLNRWAGQPLPISASCWHDGVLVLRLSGAAVALAAARATLGGEPVSDVEAGEFWRALRDQTHAFFGAATLWRLSLPASAPMLDLPGATLLEWHGGQRWLAGGEAANVREAAARAGGHAALYRGDAIARNAGAFAPLSEPMLALHRRVKQVFDPAGILNPGRLYAEL
ncbi:MAG TPA: glycolate oxidase subunit GlcE [Verrucomicrobiae bacterium]|nr:glycolate oxidase subunit GlcE [Verrucomicrobiae bacterium]